MMLDLLFSTNAELYTLIFEQKEGIDSLEDLQMSTNP